MHESDSSSTSPSSAPAGRAAETSPAEIRSSDTCPVCQELMADPVALSCGHSYCMQCLKRVVLYKPECCACRANLAYVDQMNMRVNVALADSLEERYGDLYRKRVQAVREEARSESERLVAQCFSVVATSRRSDGPPEQPSYYWTVELKIPSREQSTQFIKQSSAVAAALAQDDAPEPRVGTYVDRVILRAASGQAPRAGQIELDPFKFSGTTQRPFDFCLEVQFRTEYKLPSVCVCHSVEVPRLTLMQQLMRDSEDGATEPNEWSATRTIAQEFNKDTHRALVGLSAEGAQAVASSGSGDSDGDRPARATRPFFADAPNLLPQPAMSRRAMDEDDNNGQGVVFGVIGNLMSAVLGAPSVGVRVMRLYGGRGSGGRASRAPIPRPGNDRDDDDDGNSGDETDNAGGNSSSSSGLLGEPLQRASTATGQDQRQDNGGSDQLASRIASDVPTGAGSATGRSARPGRSRPDLRNPSGGSSPSQTERAGSSAGRSPRRSLVDEALNSSLLDAARADRSRPATHRMSAYSRPAAAPADFDTTAFIAEQAAQAAVRAIFDAKRRRATQRKRRRADAEDDDSDSDESTSDNDEEESDAAHQG